MTAAVLNERTFLVPEVSNCIYSGADISIKVETVENGIEVRNSVKPETKEPETSMLKHHKEELDPKLLQVAQLFVQDLLVRAKIEAHKKLASSENQALLHEDTFVAEDHSTDYGFNSQNFVERVHQEVRRKCRRIYNLFLSCLGHLP